MNMFENLYRVRIWWMGKSAREKDFQDIFWNALSFMYSIRVNLNSL